ncbi:MAG: hemolysin family protein [Phycisphaerales bacterium]|nr:hemolysin family protein [Phycisphaerales bacterium]
MELLVLLLLIGINGVLAMSEIAVVSSRRVRLEQAAARGHRGAKAALALVESPTRFLSTVQVGITLAGITAGAYAEAAIADDLAATIGRDARLAPYSHLIATGIVVLGITYLSLVLGELLPKRLAMNNPEKIASLIAPFMRVLSQIIAPFVNFLTFSTDLLLRLFPKKPEGSELATAEEIKGLMEKSTEAGVFHEQEQWLVERIFRLGDPRVTGLMVPRTDITWLESDAPAERIRVAVATSSHSHFPVCKGGLDHIVGVVHLKDLVKSGLLTKSVDLKVLARQPLFVPESMAALRLLDEFRRTQMHIAFILDEYGVLAGLITLNDLVESILGQMARGGEETEPLAVRREDGSWLLDGALPVEDLKAIMHVETLPHQQRTSFQTVAGFVMTYLGRVPRTGDHFVFDRFRFEVVDMDRHRIDKVLLSFRGEAVKR